MTCKHIEISYNNFLSIFKSKINVSGEKIKNLKSSLKENIKKIKNNNEINYFCLI